MVSRIVALVVGLITGSASAHAHALLQGATPAVGGRVAKSSSALDLYFTEGVVPHFSKVEVLGPSGQRVRTGELRVSGGGRELIVPIPPLMPGHYIAMWHVTSEDTHKTEGRFSFTVAP